MLEEVVWCTCIGDWDWGGVGGDVEDGMEGCWWGGVGVVVVVVVVIGGGGVAVEEVVEVG